MDKSDQILAAIAAIAVKVDRLETKVDHLETKVDRLESDVADLKSGQTEILREQRRTTEAVARLEGRVQEQSSILQVALASRVSRSKPAA